MLFMKTDSNRRIEITEKIATMILTKKDRLILWVCLGAVAIAMLIWLRSQLIDIMFVPLAEVDNPPMEQPR
jgi:hypothetical protein